MFASFLMKLSRLYLVNQILLLFVYVNSFSGNLDWFKEKNESFFNFSRKRRILKDRPAITHRTVPRRRSWKRGTPTRSPKYSIAKRPPTISKTIPTIGWRTEEVAAIQCTHELSVMSGGENFVNFFSESLLVLCRMLGRMESNHRVGR